MRKNVLIAGGGIAGLWTAWELSKLGLSTVIVETAPFLGGHVAQFSCKATDTCQRCGACLLEDVLRNLNAVESVTSLVDTSISLVEHAASRFTVDVLQQPSRIVPERCNDCGDCAAACPQPGALTRSPLDRRLAIDETVCRYYTDGSCRACLEACAESAVNLESKPQEASLEVDAVVIATGFKPFDPHLKPRFGYGRVPGVMTSLELDSLLRTDNWTPGTDIRSVAFIQCVGSRDPKIGRNYCSQVCCGNAMRLARLLKHRFTEIEPTMFYMDIQTYDRDFTRRLSEAAREVRLVRAIPAEIRSGGHGRPEILYQGPQDVRVCEAFDLVVLSIGISPGNSEVFESLLGSNPNMDGLLGPDGEQVSTTRQGVFVAGAAQGPRSIKDTVSHATKAAYGAFQYVKSLERGEGR